MGQKLKPFTGNGDVVSIRVKISRVGRKTSIKQKLMIGNIYVHTRNILFYSENVIAAVSSLGEIK